jgi:ABC-type Fe3+ transport system substrate-binding protein
MNRIIMILLFVLVLGAPLVLQPSRELPPPGARPLVIITPHNEQIRAEFKEAFEAWHQREYDEAVAVIWSVPGGTSEIRRMLTAQFEAAIEDGREPGGSADLVFGGGSYEHTVLKQGVAAVAPDGTERTVSISVPGGLDPAAVSALYGEPPVIGDARLWDEDGYWYGTAVSGFGVMWNRDALAMARGVTRDTVVDPTGWEDLCAPDLRGWVALVNPAQSGSITTAFDAILQRKGWVDGWRILRRAAANARYFSASSLKPPTDVSLGDAAMGVCIDFYGRFQAQAVREAGDPDRLGYLDPRGATVIDPDPISMLRGAPSPELARRFIEFTLTPEAQSLWQFPATEEGSAHGGLGPRRFELRRLPILRSMYAEYGDRMIDQVDPFSVASAVAEPNRDIRSFIAPIFSAMAMDNHHELTAAWRAITSHPAYPPGDGIVTAEDVDDPELASMLREFDAMPEIPIPGGETRSLDTDAFLTELKRGWLRGGFAETGLWHPDESPEGAMRRLASRGFRDRYRSIVRSAG